MEYPAISVLLSLAAGIGVPFTLLSAQNPLLQTWWTHHGEDSEPYWLTVPSNVGCIIALLAFPILFEPRFSLSVLVRLWTVSYIILAILVICCSFMAYKANVRRTVPRQTDTVAPLTTIQKWRWFSLSVLPSGLLAAVTLYACTQLVPIPLLWTLPLVLYLGTFVIAFSRYSNAFLPFMTRGTPLVAILWIICLVCSEKLPFTVVFIFHFFGFFWLCLSAHLHLASLRPKPNYLTHYFLIIAIGGAVGGFTSALLAPILFKGLFEFPLFLVLTMSAILFYGRKIKPEKEILLGPTVVVSVLLFIRYFQETAWSDGPSFFVTVIIISLILRNRRALVGLILGVLISIPWYLWYQRDRVIYSARSFYGINKVHVNKSETTHWLVNGVTSHGGQFVVPEMRRVPFSYYHSRGPLGDIFDVLNTRTSNKRVAVIGLGAAGMLAYAKNEDHWTFFELDPVVHDMAMNPKLFTYIQDSPCPVRVVDGDARMTLNLEPESNFDLIIIDAFGSDWIPTHLLTREALSIYLQKLKTGGTLVFHLSNQFADLWPVVSGISKDKGLSVVRKQYFPTPQEQANSALGSRWVALCQDEQLIETLLKKGGWNYGRSDPRSILWTDEFSSVAKVVTLWGGN